MPKSPKKGKWYAVRHGREGAKIYDNWGEAEINITRFPGAVHKSFRSLKDAEDWLTSRSMSIKKEPKEPSPEIQELPGPPMPGPSKPRNPTPATMNGVHPQPAPQPAVGLNAPQPSQVQLSPEQRHVLEMVKRGKSVFFTGSAGTGKSVLLREIIKFCRNSNDYGDWGRLSITASTGIASVNIGGSTLHSWAGIGLGKESKEKLVYKLLGYKKEEREQEEKENPDAPKRTDDMNSGFAVDRWRTTRTLIIDEISMIDGHLFDKLEYVARAVRKNSAPFGGIQLVLSGDFLQLPPVPEQVNGAPVPPSFAFEAESWEQCVGRPVFLTKVFRQKDQTFVDILNSMRFGHLEAVTVQKFRQLSRTVRYNDGIEPTDLFPTRREVEMCNHNRLKSINSTPHEYKATDRPGRDEKGNDISLEKMNRLLERLVAPKTITLKVGAQVMLIKNMIQGKLVNGSVGKVVDFITPLEAAQRGTKFAISESNCSGMPPMGREVKMEKWPVVQFQSGDVLLCIPDTFEVNNPEGEIEAMRCQVPLILAWALSIHKSQGQTLDRVRVNLGRIFEKGQAYVALSRATSMERLQVLNFDAAKVMAHPRVMAWMKEQTGQQARDQIDEDIEFWSEDIDIL